MRSLIQNLKSFIAIDTVTTRSNAALARRVGRFLRNQGFRVMFQTVQAKGSRFVNVVGLKGDPRQKPLLLTAHLDTVPPGPHTLWTRTAGDPWSATLRGNAVYGLGAADDKGPLSAILEALRTTRDLRLKRPLLFLGTFGEESGMKGALLFTHRWKGKKPFLALAAEPTDLGITFRHKGLGVVEMKLVSSLKTSRSAASLTFRFKGKQGHSSRPDLAVNALDKAARFLSSQQNKFRGFGVSNLSGGQACNLVPGDATLGLRRLDKKRGRGRGVPVFPIASVLACRGAVERVILENRQKDRLFNPPRLTSTFAVAAKIGHTLCLTFDFRLLPNQSMRSILRDLRGRLRSIPCLRHGVRVQLRVERDNPPLDLNGSHRSVRLAKEMSKKSGLPVRLLVKAGCTEAGLYRRWGVPALVFGPGRSTGNIHAPNEEIALSELQKAVRFYENLIRGLCGDGAYVSHP